jgi:Glycosyltransferase family 87
MREAILNQRPIAQSSLPAHAGMRALCLLFGVLALVSAIGWIANQCTPGILEKTGLVRGWDFQQFYLAARMPLHGLYDVDAFQDLQRSLFPVDEQNILFLPLYPPTTALAFGPLAFLPYLWALGVWTAISFICYVIAGRMLLFQTETVWRPVVFWGLAGFFPFLVSLRAGQLVPVLLLIVVAGLHKRNGWLLSLLALKPQFAAGLLFVLLLRRQWKLCATFLAGIGLQFALVVAIAGPEPVTEYVQYASVYLDHARMFTFPDGWVHSISGTAGRLAHVAVLIVVSILLAAMRRNDWRIESAIAVAFMLLFTPHLLLYDLVLLVVPAILLLPDWKIPAAIAVSSATIAMPLHAYTGLSSVPWVLVILIATRFVADERTKMSLTIDSPAKGSVA